MLNSRELRIGNIIDLGIVAGVYPSTEDIYNIWLHNGLSFSTDQLSGEVINEEWLVNFGFEYNNDVFWLRSGKNILFQFKLSGGFNFHWKDYNQNIQYVHQLQNIYFALTGEELKLKQEAK
jgi:hypothetical protein